MYGEAWLLNLVKLYLEQRTQKPPKGTALKLIQLWREGGDISKIFQDVQVSGPDPLYKKIEAILRFQCYFLSETATTGYGFGISSGRAPKPEGDEGEHNEGTSEASEEEDEQTDGDPAEQADLLSEMEQVRAKAIGKFYALVAADLPEVRLFRSEVLGGQFEGKSSSVNLDHDVACFFAEKTTRWHKKTILTADDARRLLASKALRYLGRFDLRERSIRAVDLSSRVLDSDGSEYTDRFLLQQGTLIFGYGNHEERFPLDEGESRWEVSHLRYFQDDGWFHQIGVSKTSVLGDLQNIAVKLSGYYGWDEQYAAWFVLTGNPPPTSHLRVGHLHSWSTISRCLITIEVDPWVSEESVLRAYRSQQQQALRYSAPKEAGEEADPKRRFRVPLTGKNAKKGLALFTFLLEQEESGALMFERICQLTDNEVNKLPEDRRFTMWSQNPLTAGEWDALLSSWREYVTREGHISGWKFNGGRREADPRSFFKKECREVVRFLTGPYRSPLG